MAGIRETRCENYGILDGLTPALPQIWRHWVRGIPQTQCLQSMDRIRPKRDTAPISHSLGARSCTWASSPTLCRAIAAVSPPIPPPIIMAFIDR
jgi:hypothetical protein